MPSHQERREPLPKGYQFGDAREVVVLFRGIPIEIVCRYENGERQIEVSREVFKAYDEALQIQCGGMIRMNASAFNQPPSLIYKDARVVLMK